ncbi:MAG: hypothetical protein H0X42_03695 [Solirubrobacterales bacterium]|nr:hypothetical protein [Solirubrobacterales bacterium]
MWAIDVICSDPGCAEEFELLVEELDEVDLAACLCGCTTVTLRVSEVRPLSLAGR